MLAIIRLATEVDPCLGPIDAATELLGRVAPDGHDGSADASLAERITRRWIDDPAPELVRAVNSALVLLADHGLATSTLAVRVATSVRASPISALIAGLATVQGDLHGAESSHAHRLLVAIERDGADAVLADDGRRHQRVAGFGHKIYRDRVRVEVEGGADVPRGSGDGGQRLSWGHGPIVPDRPLTRLIWCLAHSETRPDTSQAPNETRR